MSKDDEDGASNPRRTFMRKAASVAVGAGVLAVSGEALAAPKPAATTKANSFAFSSTIAPGALTAANIAKISDAVTAALASEAQAGIENAPEGFHVRVGGGHSRTFSKTSEHKNVTHSQIIISGSFP